MLEGSLDLKSKFEKAGGSKKVTWTVLPPVARSPQPALSCYLHMHTETDSCGARAQTQSRAHMRHDGRFAIWHP